MTMIKQCCYSKYLYILYLFLTTTLGCRQEKYKDFHLKMGRVKFSVDKQPAPRCINADPRPDTRCTNYRSGVTLRTPSCQGHLLFRTRSLEQIARIQRPSPEQEQVLQSQSTILPQENTEMLCCKEAFLRYTNLF